MFSEGRAEMSQKELRCAVQSRVLIGRKVSEFPSTPPVLTLVLGGDIISADPYQVLSGPR